jgi:hypothetical protein
VTVGFGAGEAMLKTAEVFRFDLLCVMIRDAFNRPSISRLLNDLRSKLPFGFGVARVLVAVALLLMIVSCARQQSIELSVERAVLENSLSGKPAMTVYFNSNSAREFEIFTAKRFGYFMEVKFHDVILGRGIIRNPIGGGHFEILVLPDRFDGTLNEGNAAEIAQKLSSGDAKLEARVADSAKTRLWEWKN